MFLLTRKLICCITFQIYMWDGSNSLFPYQINYHMEIENYTSACWIPWSYIFLLVHFYTEVATTSITFVFASVTGYKDLSNNTLMAIKRFFVGADFCVIIVHVFISEFYTELTKCAYLVSYPLKLRKFGRINWLCLIIWCIVEFHLMYMSNVQGIDTEDGNQ